jgi:predicted ester cyclase
VYEVALLRIVNGQMVEGWYMMDEAELLRQLGAKLPPRPDGKLIAPPLPDTADAATFLSQLESRSAVSKQDMNKLAAARSRLSPQARSGAGRQLRQGFAHLRAYSKTKGHGELDLEGAFPDRGYGMDVLMAEGDQVWMRFNVGGTHRGSLCGIAPTGKRVGVNGVAILNFSDGGWVDSWTFADELGLLLQLGRPNLLLE